MCLDIHLLVRLVLRSRKLVRNTVMTRSKSVSNAVSLVLKYNSNHSATDTSSFRALYFSMLEEEHKEPSKYKLVVLLPEEKVLGIHIIGMGSDEVMQGFGVAVKMGGKCNVTSFCSETKLIGCK